MKTNLITLAATKSGRFAHRLATTLSAAALLLPLAARAVLVGPYTADSSTLHLWHMDSTAAPVPDAVSTGGTNLVGLLNGALLTNASFAGFGYALNTIDGGADGIATTNRDALLTPSTANPPANVLFSYSDPTTGAFTYEAIVWVGFDPAKNLGTVANGGNGRNGSFQIVSCESSVNAGRIFQFRIMPIGTALLGTTLATGSPYLTFENVRAISGNQPTIYAPIPTTGLDAIVSNQWYHVAVTYSGVPNTAGNIKLYWTLLDPSRTAANQLTITSAQTTLSGPNPLGSTATPIVVGNEARSRLSNFLGLVDEVRISKVARGPSSMMFAPANVVIDTEPVSQFVAAGETVTLTSSASGGGTVGYQWQFHSTNLPGANNFSLVLTNITTAQAGPYRVIATNISSSATSLVATVRVGASMGEIFNTGVAAPGIPAALASVDTHWQMVQSDDPAYPGPAAIVISTVPAAWLANTTNSQWIGPVASGNAIGGNYTYQSSFLLDTLDPANAQLTLYWAVDNSGLDVRLNGVSIGATNGGYAGLTSLVITNGFVAGSNLVECVVSNAPGTGPNPTGLRAELRGVAMPLPPTAIQLASLPADATVVELHSTNFISLAIGSGPLTYQWYHGLTPLAGQTNRILSLTAVTAAQAGLYTVYVTNSLGFTNASATLTVITPPSLAWTGLNSADWDTATINWVNTGTSTGTTYAQNDYVLFDSRGSLQPTVNLTDTLTPNGIVVNAEASFDYLFTSFAANGALSGVAALEKKGPGTLVLDVTNNLTGPVSIKAGKLQVGVGNIYGTLGTGSVSNEATLAFNRADAVLVPNAISGSGTLVNNGSGAVILTASNTYSGPTLVANGSVNVRNSSALGAITTGTSVSNYAQLFIDANVNVAAEPLDLAGPGPAYDGALRKGGAGTSTLASPITLLADAAIGVDSGSTLNLTNASGIAGSGFILTLTGAGRGNALGPISLGTGYVVKDGTGTWELAATNNTWTSGLQINAGTLQIGDGGTNGNDGSLGTGGITNNGALTIFSATNFTLTAAIEGTGALNQNGVGTTTLSGSNSYTGVTYVNGGTLVVGSPNVLGTVDGNTVISGNVGVTSRVALVGGITLAEPFLLTARQPVPDVGALAAHIINLSGTNTLTGAITVQTGGNQYNLESAAGLLVIASNYSQVAGTGARFLNLQGAGDAFWTGAINDGTANVTVTKRGTGTWTLAGTNTYSGTTTVSNGTLLVTGGLGTNSVTVVGGTLGGTGLIEGPVSITSAGTLAPGVSLGTLTISNSLVLAGVVSMKVNQALGTSDEVVGLTSVTYGGTLVVTNLAGTLTAADSFKLFSAATYAGVFASVTPPPGAGLAWDTNTLASDGVLRLKSSVVPKPVITSVGLVGGSLVFQGTNGTPGSTYSVLASTNIVAPLTNWVLSSSGTFRADGSFNCTNAVNSAVPHDFFLLRVP